MIYDINHQIRRIRDPKLRHLLQSYVFSKYVSFGRIKVNTPTDALVRIYGSANNVGPEAASVLRAIEVIYARWQVNPDSQRLDLHPTSPPYKLSSTVIIQLKQIALGQDKSSISLSLELLLRE